MQEAKAVLARIQSTSPAQLNQARANLDRIAEVRPVNVKQNQVEIDRAIAAMKQVKAELNQAYVRSPINGEILEIHTRAGIPFNAVTRSPEFTTEQTAQCLYRKGFTVILEKLKIFFLPNPLTKKK